MRYIEILLVFLIAGAFCIVMTSCSFKVESAQAGAKEETEPREIPKSRIVRYVDEYAVCYAFVYESRALSCVPRRR